MHIGFRPSFAMYTAVQVLTGLIVSLSTSKALAVDIADGSIEPYGVAINPAKAGKSVEVVPLANGSIEEFVSGAALTALDKVVVNADGKVIVTPGAADTYYQIGIVQETVAGADEVVTVVIQQAVVVVS